MRISALIMALFAAAVAGASSSAILATSRTDDSYMGCFVDDQNARVLMTMTASREMTSEFCAAYCANESSRNKYYATQYGKECWCAPSVDLRRGEGTCDYACAGAPETTCGGYDAFDLFQLGRINPPSEDYYLGCFADDRNDRVLEDKISSDDMALQLCENHCMARNKPFFALQWGKECWCGGCELLDEGNHRFDRHGSTSCIGYPCTGETSRDCGAVDAFSLYYRGTCGGSMTPTGFPTTGHPTTSEAFAWTLTPTGAPTAAPTSASYTDPPDAQSLSWLHEGTEVTVRETAQWAAVMRFEVPESGGELAELYFNEELLQQIRVGTELYRPEYDTNGEISDLVLVDSDVGGRRVLQSGEQGDYHHFPAWLTRDTVKGVTTTSRIGCDPCALILNFVCQGIGVACKSKTAITFFLAAGIVLVKNPIAVIGAIEFACSAIDAVCFYEDAVVFHQYLPNTCRDFFCCDRSKCGKFGDCYDEENEKCCDDESLLVPVNGCCPGDDLAFTCGEGPPDGDGVRPLLCYDADAEQCCADDVIHPKNECCPGQWECGGECFDASESQCCDGKVETCCNAEVPCGERCHDPQKTQCCSDGNILDKNECCAGFVGFNGAVECCADGSSVEATECCPGQEKCQGTCYDPTERECCEDGPLVEGCPRACDDGSTVLESNGECCPNEIQCIYGSSCYVPDDSICCEDDSIVDKGAACPPVAPPTPAPITPPPQPVQEFVPKRGGNAGGDPHIQVYDSTSRYDCHGQGEFVLTNAAATESEVQVRFEQWSANPNPSFTVTTGVAAREGASSVVQVMPAASSLGLEVLVDGQLYDDVAGLVTGVALEVLPTRAEIRFPSGLDVFVSTWTSGILRVNAFVPLDLATTGLLGNNNGEAGDDFKTAAGETVEFAGARPTVAEGTNYCTTNWCTTEGSSIFTYAEGEDHGTFDLCDAVYPEPVLPDVVPATIVDLCGDNADCTFDALLAGEEVGQATLQAEEADRVMQEEFGAICESGSFSSTGTPPCTECPAGEVSGPGATACVSLGGVDPTDAPGTPMAPMSEEEPPPSFYVAQVMLQEAQAVGVFAGPGSLNTTMASTIELTDAELGSIPVSGTFVLDNPGAALEGPLYVFFYIENAEHPEDVYRGQQALDPATGDFSAIVTDVPAGSSRLFLSFVIKGPVWVGFDYILLYASSLFAFDVSNTGCVPSLTITLEWFDARSDDDDLLGVAFSDMDLIITEPGGTLVTEACPPVTVCNNGVGSLQNKDSDGFGPENYIIFGGLDPDTSQVLGDYEAQVVVQAYDPASPPIWRVTARVRGFQAWVWEGDIDSVDDYGVVTLTEFDIIGDSTCGGGP